MLQLPISELCISGGSSRAARMDLQKKSTSGNLSSEAERGGEVMMIAEDMVGLEWREIQCEGGRL